MYTLTPGAANTYSAHPGYSHNARMSIFPSNPVHLNLETHVPKHAYAPTKPAL